MMIAEKPQKQKKPYILGRLAKYGFRFLECAGEYVGLMTVVEGYVKQHLAEQGYDPNTIPAATNWFATCAPDKDGKERVWGVTGIRPTQGGIEVTDLYVNHSSMGILASYAALEEIRLRADQGGFRVLGMTPDTNAAMIKAFDQVFGVSAPIRKLAVFEYRGGSDGSY